jgi:predicted ATPase
MSTDNLHIVTGAPGTGKTTVIEHRGFRFFDTMGEPAREIIAERQPPGQRGGFSGPASDFVELLVQRSILKHQAAVATRELTIFDRGLPDCVAYALFLGVDPAPSIEAATRFRYANRVFLLTPWEKIYATDSDRTMTYEMTVVFHDRVVEAYDLLGYDLLEVPQARVIDRVEFIIDHLDDVREAIIRRL